MKDSAPSCEDMADKLVSLFGWRQTYPVQKLQRSIQPKPTIITGPESWVVVRNIRSESGGILDPDDRVRDVADDRETLTADTGAGLPPGPLAHPPRALHHAGGDGASAGSSVGTASPDIFRGGGSGRGGGGDAGCGVEVGAADGAAGLQVRRGSEPNLQDVMPTQTSMTQIPDHTKRWSAAVVCRDDKSHIHKSVADGRSPDPHPSMDSNRLNPNTAQPFQRQTNRLSMQFSGPGSGVWMDAAERVQSSNTKSLPRDSARKDPLGQDTNASANNQNHRVEDMLRWVSGVNGTVKSPSGIQERPLDLLPEVNGHGPGKEVDGAILEVPVSAGPGTLGRSSGGSGHRACVSLVKGEKGLGFTITTRDNPTGGVCPIYIKNILPKGAAVLDGRLHAGDKLVSVNGVSVWGLSQQQVVSLLRNTPTHSTVTIVVERPGGAHSARHLTHNTDANSSPQKYKENVIGSPNSNGAMNGILNRSVENEKLLSIVRDQPGTTIINQGQQSSSQAPGGSGRQLQKSASNNDLEQKLNSSSNSLLQNALNSSNTVVGLRNRLIMRLDVPVYDSEKAGLGISVKGKVTVGEHPQDLGIFIKSVLNGGAASRDGRLHKNDQLLNVNGVSLEQQTNAEAMEALRKALLHTPSAVRGSITLTIARRTDSCDSLARWKNDTPPSDQSNQSNENSNTNSFSVSANNNTVIYNHAQQKSLDSIQRNSIHRENSYEATKPNSNMNNNSQTKKHSSIVTINNNVSWVNNQSDDSKGYLERDDSIYSTEPNKRDSFEWSRLDGWNPVLDRLTGLRNESYYIATQEERPPVNGHRDIPRTHQMAHQAHLMQRSPPSHHNVIIEEDYGTIVAPTPNSGGPWESGSESVGEGSAGDAAFSRDAIGRRSMSEKRHAAMDAKATGTYKKLKEQRTANAVPVGPSLGMRKSSSLESLQTAMQEMSMHQPRPGLARPRAHQPLKHWLTDGPGALEGAMVRGSPQQSSLSHKKPGLLKSISSMLRFGHKRPKGTDGSEIYGRTQPHRSSEKSLSREAIERINAPKHTSEDRTSDRLGGEGLYSVGHSRQASGERMQGDRLPGERLPGDRLPRERLPGDRLPDPADAQRSRQHWAAPPYRLPPARTSPSSHTMSQVMEGAWGGTHYVNYEEIQQNLNARREKLSEVQIGQMRRQVHAQRVKADEESRRAGLGGANSCSGGVGGYHSQRGRSEQTARPTSNYYEYETIQHARPVHTKVTTYH